MLQAFGLTYSPDPRVGALFENIHLSLDRGDKVALVGRNGAGKSLLVQILFGLLKPTSGRVVRMHGARVAYLPQDFDHGFAGTLAELLGENSSNAPGYAVARAVHRMGLAPAVLNQPYSTLSVGEKMRGSLAAILASDPDVLLLDEPTNHLDVETKEWLERFLRNCPEAVLIVCHDRSVINAVADRVLELSAGGLTEYAGGYDDMVEAKRIRDERQTEAWSRHRLEDRRLRVAAEETLQSAAKMSAKPTTRTYDPKAKAFYAGKEARMDKRAKAIRSRVEKGRQDAPQKPFIEESIELCFPSKPLRSTEVLVVRNLSKRFGDRHLFGGLNMTLERGSRLAVVGRNGCGKTTLFRILTGDETADGGEFSWSSGCQIAELSQERDLFDGRLSAIQALAELDASSVSFARTALARLGMRGDSAERPIGVLSVGERTKVEIVSMLLTGANVLILDEPTNHLDLVSVEALESALKEFPGAILFTSHDREFVSRLATETIQIG